MKKQHLFTLDIGLVQRLHRQIARGHRSQFVEQAIRGRLDGKDDFSTYDIPTRQLMAMLFNRLEDRVDAAAEMMRVFLKEELA